MKRIYTLESKRTIVLVMNNDFVKVAATKDIQPSQMKEVEVAGEVVEVYYRNILDCVKALFGDPQFAKCLKYAPERHYIKDDDGNTSRVYHEMYTGEWWWQTQV